MFHRDPEKAREQSRKWAQANPETCRERSKRYYYKNKDKEGERKKWYYWKNREKLLERNKRYRQEHPEKVEDRKKRYRVDPEKQRERYRRYCHENKDKERERKRQYYRENKEKHREAMKRYRQTTTGRAMRMWDHHKRRAILASCPVNDLTTTQVKFVLEKAKNCKICGHKFSKKLAQSIDHIQSVNKGGFNTIANIQIVCIPCNSRKRDRDYTHYSNGQLLMFIGEPKKELCYQET